MRNRVIAIAIIGMFLLVSRAFAQPSMMSYQGELLKDGVPWNADADFKFAILDGATTLWSNDGSSGEPTQSVTLAVSNGVFSVLLGASPMVALTSAKLMGATAPALRVWVDTGGGFEQLSDQPLASTAYALVAANGAPTSGVYSVSSFEFFPSRDTDAYVHATGFAGAYGVGFTALSAVVHLPDGATVTSFTAYYDDASASDDIRILLRPIGLAGPTGIGSMAEVQSSGTPGESSGTDTSILNATIDNSTHAYFITAVPAVGGAWDGSDLSVYGAKIEYELK